MPVYQSTDEFHSVLQEGFQRLGADPQALNDFQRRRMTVVLQTHDPETAVVIDGRANPVKTSFGNSAGQADLRLTMGADLLHDILMGNASVKASFMSGAVQVTGNVFRAMQLADLFHQIQRVYPQVRRDLGYGA